MRTFRWIPTADIPHEFDLRRYGWSFDPAAAGDACVTIGHYPMMDWSTWTRFLFDQAGHRREMVMLLAVSNGNERAHLLRMGYGEALGPETTLNEIEARACAIASRAVSIQRSRAIGALRIDILEREAFVGQVPVNLHPREFALLWRLADQPGRPVTKRQLLRDVWRIGYIPETNSLAVHVSRLREKLRRFGLDWMITTTASGDYMLTRRKTDAGPALFGGAPQTLDAHVLRRDLQTWPPVAARTSADET